MTDLAVDDRQGDDVAYAAVGNGEPLRWGISLGTSPYPVSDVGPVFKIAKTEELSVADFVNGQTNEQSACLTLMNKGTKGSQVQANAAYFVAQTSSEQTAHNDDAMGLGVTGRVTGGGTGIGIGAYMSGRRDTDTGKANGLEVRCWNNTPTDGTYNPYGFSDTTGIWLNCAGPAGRVSGCGLTVGSVLGCQWDVGIGFVKIGGVSAVKSYSIRDDSDSETSIAINGSHPGGALVIAPGSGPVNLGGTVANPDTSGLRLGELETEVNEIKQTLRDFGLIAT